MSRINCKKELVGDSVWVACSGGVDSIAIAHYLLKKLKREVKLFHFNHALRAQNWEMESSVKRFAKDFGFHLEVRRAHWALYELEKSPSEAECRAKRLEALNQVIGDGYVVYGHHLNDCVESYLMNCFNGVGHYVPIPISTGFDEFTLVRPFMLTPKLALEKYADHHQLDKYIVKDETNSNTEYRRNWVRHKAIPMIEEEYPGLEKVVSKKMVKFYEEFYNQDFIDCHLVDDCLKYFRKNND